MTRVAVAQVKIANVTRETDTLKTENARIKTDLQGLRGQLQRLDVCVYGGIAPAVLAGN